MRKWGWALLVAVFACSLSGCWLQLGGNMGRTAFVSGETALTNGNVSTLHQVWSNDVSVFGATSPLVDRGKVLVATGDELTALNASDGSQAWHDDFSGTQPPTFDQPALWQDQLIVPWFYAGVGGLGTFDPGTGAGSLNGNGPGSLVPYNAPAVSDTTSVYVVGAVSQAGAIAAIHLGSMNGFIDFAPLGGGSVGRASSPMLSNNHAYVSYKTKVLAFALDSCPPGPGAGYCGALWTSADLGSTGGMPVAVSATELAVPLANGNIAVLDGASGALQWTAVTGSTAAQSPAIDGSNIYVGTSGGKVRAFAVSGCGNATCTPVWTSPQSAGAAIVSQPVVAGGVVYVGTAGGALVAFDASNGARLKSIVVDAASNQVNVIEDGGTVYASTNSGVVAAYRP